MGQALVARGVVTRDQVADALDEQGRTGHLELLGEILVRQRHCTEDQVAEALAECCGVPYARIRPGVCDPLATKVLPREFCQEHVVLPLFRVHRTLTLAVSEPANPFLFDEIEHRTGCGVQVVCATAKDILATLWACSPAARVFAGGESLEDKGLRALPLVPSETTGPGPGDRGLVEAAGQPAVIDLVHRLLCEAVREHASSLHIEPGDRSVRVRYRVDGRLFEKTRPPGPMHAAILARVKILSGLDVAQVRVAQEGRFRVTVDDRTVDLGVSILPGAWGETAAIRILDPQSRLTALESLGFTLENLRRFRQAIRSPHGLFVVAGPAGSGKGTTLRAAVSELNREDVHVCTVEDPLGGLVPGLNQFEVGPGTGGDLAQTLRQVLRQDPDVVMLSEIRDPGTADLAVQAALDGRLVLATLSSHCADLAVRRLADLEVPACLAGDALVGVLAQRLVRKICPHCKQVVDPPGGVRRAVARLGQEVPQYYRGAGCEVCRNTGCAGRIALHELLIPDETVREGIRTRAAPGRLRALALEAGMVPMALDGIEKVRAGLIPIEEVLRTAPLGG